MDFRRSYRRSLAQRVSVTLWSLAALLALFTTALSTDARAQDGLTSLKSFPRSSTEADFLEELTLRHLDRTVVAFCRERLGTPKLSATERFSLAGALLRAQFSIALDSPSEDRDVFWAEASATIREQGALLERPAAALLELDLVLAELQRNHLGVLELDWRPFDNSLRRAAASGLLSALARRTTLDRELDRIIPAKETGGFPSRTLWEDRRRAARLAAGWGELDLVRLSQIQPNQPDLAGSARRAEGLFNAALNASSTRERSETAFTSSTTTDAQLEASIGLAVAKLAQGDVEGACQRISEALKADPTHPNLDRWMAWQANLGSPAPPRTFPQDVSKRLLRSDVVAPSPELALFEFDDLLRDAAALSQSPDGSSDMPLDDGARSRSQEFDQRIAKAMTRFRERYRSRWVFIADAAAQRVRLTARYGAEVAIAVGEASGQWDQQNFPESIVAWRRAITTAVQQKRDNVAFDLRRRAGALLVEREEWGTAAEFLLAAGDSNDPRAAETHLLACYALGRDSESSKDRAPWIQALEAHLRRFPDSPTRPDALWQRGQAALAEEDWPDALAHFREIPNISPRAASALAGMTTAYRRLSQVKDLSSEERSRLISDAQATLEPRIGPAPSTDTQVDAALFLAESALRLTPPDYQSAERWLGRVADRPSDENAPPAWLPRAHQLFILALAGRGEIDAAKSRLRSLSPRPKELLAVLDGLDEMARAQPAARQALAQLQRDAAFELDGHREKLTEGEQVRLDRTLAEAYLATGDRPAAVLRYRSLAQRQPRDQTVQKALARLLLAGEDQRERLEALALFRRMESAQKTGTDGWLECRLDHCRALARTGDKVAALKLIQVTRLLYPKLGGKSLSAEFADLERSLRQSPPSK